MVLQNIFSIKNKDIHKVIILFGIKFKFKSKKLLKRNGVDKNSFLEDIFSVKNQVHGETKHKVVKICGIKFKTRIKKPEMKLGVSYNLFDGEELLEYSIKNIRPEAYYINVIYQKKSYYGNNASSNIENLLFNLKHRGLIDEVYLYDKDISKFNTIQEIETDKRNIGYIMAKKFGCTHHLSMDVDEFYETDKLSNAKKYIMDNNISLSACSIIEYLKNPKYKLFGYTFSPSENYNFYVPFIVKIGNNNEQYAYLQDFFPCLVDPTRKFNPSGRFYLFETHKIAMHHMCTVRKNLVKKYTNSTYNEGSAQTLSQIQEIKNKVLNWEFDSNKLSDKYALFDGKIVEKVDNIFNIELKESNDNA